VVGTTFLHYRVLALLGRGGMGEVYLAEDTKLQRRVALKVLSAETVDPTKSRARLAREAHILASLSHPNIVSIHAVETVGEQPVIVMELVEGEPLDRLIGDRGLPLEPLLRIAAGIADALAAAHEQGITHRDLKPSNVIVTRSGRPKVLDFGLAKLRRDLAVADETTAALTQTGAIVGTLPYMAPEQLLGRQPDARSDVFSLGVMLYEMAVGRRPFVGDSPPELVSAILRDTPGPVEHLRPELPTALARLTRRCLDKDPDRRYQSAKDVRNELEDIHREQNTMLATSPVPSDTTRRWLSGAILAATLVAIVLLALIPWRPFLDGLRHVPSASPTVQSVAVLPFQLQVGGDEDQYLVEGMHDALVTNLSKIGALRVISRSSTLRYRASDRPVPEIARELGVDAVIEGSVLLAGDRVRVSAQLISGETDANLWAESYDRDVGDVLALLSDVARAIARGIQVAVTSEEERRLASVPSASSDVQQAYLRARFFASRLTQADIAKALESQQAVIAMDADFAPGYAGLAEAEFLTAFFSQGPSDDLIERANAHARRALALDSGLSLAHGVLGLVHLYHEWNWSEAEREFRVALELNPGDTLSRHGLADYFIVTGDAAESLRQVELGRRSDPFSPFALLPLVGHLIFAGRQEEALKTAREIVELFPENGQARALLADTLWGSGAYAEALDRYRQIPGRAVFASALASGFDRGGPTGAAHAAAEYLAASPSTASPLTIAQYFAASCDAEASLQWLRRAVVERVVQIVHINAMRSFDRLRNDPKFLRVLEPVGFPN